MMSDEKSAISQNGPDSKPNTPDEAMQIWRGVISGLPPLDFDEVKRSLAKFRVKIPESLLTYDAFLKILSILQNMRTDLLEIKEVVDEHHTMKDGALKSLQKILVAMSECKTVAEKEGETEAWLIHLQKLVKRAYVLKNMTFDVLENLDIAIAQVNRQIRVAEMATRNQTIDVTMGEDLPRGWGDIDSEENSVWMHKRSES